MTSSAATPTRVRVVLLAGLVLAALLLAALLQESLYGLFRGTPPSKETGAVGSSREALASLGYLTWVNAADTLDLQGVTRHAAGQTAPGLNLYSPLDSHEALLVDMDGRERHRWSFASRPSDAWQHVELLPRGELLALVEEARLVALDRHSRLLWQLEGPVHHDVAQRPSGGFYVLMHEMREVVRDGRTTPVLSDSIVRLDREGAIVDRLELLPLFVDRVSEAQWNALDRWLDDFAEPIARLGPRIAMKSGSPADLFHANSVEILPRDVPGLGRAGELLVSLRDIDTVAVVDFESAKVRWSWGPGVLRRQHHPTLLGDDHLLIYDNRGGPDGRSRVVEVDPASGEIVWSFAGDPPASFFSALRGGSQRLANANTLITESDRGRAFEVTPEGRLVWEYYNPRVRPDTNERAAIYRMTRIEPAALDWLESVEAP